MRENHVSSDTAKHYFPPASHLSTMSSRKRALSDGFNADAETQTKKTKGNVIYMQPQAVTQGWDMEVDAAPQHRCDGFL